MTKTDKMAPANIKNKLKFQEDRLNNIENQFKRVVADYQNLEKRHEKQRLEYVKYANEVLLDKLLPIIDDLKRAQSHLKDSGLKLVLDNFLKTLSSEGVTPIDALSQPFNPDTMDCVQVVEGLKDQVTNVLTDGYLYHDKVLRPARVEVGGTERVSTN